jgi:hypothetical protein
MKDLFRKDRFANLTTVDAEKSATGPYYSEAFVYHYNSFDKGPTKMFEERLMHCYAPRSYMAGVSLAYTLILRDRNAQRALYASHLGLHAHASVIREARHKEFTSNKAMADVAISQSMQALVLPDGTFDVLGAKENLQKQFDEGKAELSRLTGVEAETKAQYLNSLGEELGRLTLRSVTHVDSRIRRADQNLMSLFDRMEPEDASQAGADSTPPPSDGSGTVPVPIPEVEKPTEDDKKSEEGADGESSSQSSGESGKSGHLEETPAVKTEASDASAGEPDEKDEAEEDDEKSWRAQDGLQREVTRQRALERDHVKQMAEMGISLDDEEAVGFAEDYEDVPAEPKEDFPV